ncbi:MAG TPA: low affinity iron permease family protein [Burkholderiaceae bacterium]|nr:low affinity iron permease family protein [Pollutimonas sp. M17]UYO93544.1 low affinity iron permease family protein [Pollutimonas sp. M17]HWK71646.1 low affinity iron permease family protein [Burkholderiaceae bacterium]
MHVFDQCASHVTKWAGSPLAFSLAFLVVLAWAVSGPIFQYSETWQLVINTGTTIITFLMVFLIQQSQNKDSQAMHLKLDELLQSIKEARDEMIDIEDLSEEELQKLAEQFKRKEKL